MSKYFVRYCFERTVRTPSGRDYSYRDETFNETYSSILELSDAELDSICDLQHYILRWELNHLGDKKPEYYDIDILVLNKL